MTNGTFSNHWNKWAGNAAMYCTYGAKINALFLFYRHFAPNGACNAFIFVRSR